MYDFHMNIILPIEVKMNLQKQLDSITHQFLMLFLRIYRKEQKCVSNVCEITKRWTQKSAIIREIYDRSGNSEDVIQGLMDNFDMSEDEAIITFGEFRSQYQLIKKNRLLKTPVFETMMKMKPLKNELVVSIKDIHSTKYISELSLYIDVILRMSQKPKNDFTTIVQIKKNENEIK